MEYTGPAFAFEEYIPSRTPAAFLVETKPTSF